MHVNGSQCTLITYQAVQQQQHHCLQIQVQFTVLLAVAHSLIDEY